MIRGRIVIIPLIHEWMWTADFQRQTGLTLSKNNIIIAYELHKRDINLKRLIINLPPIVVKKEGVHFFTPVHPIPFERFKLIYELNKKLSIFLLLIWVKYKFGLGKRTILWLFHPREVWLIKEFRRFLSDSFITIFYCVDHFAKGSEHEKELLIRLERKLVKEANIVVSVSRSLQNYLKGMRDDVIFVSQGFRRHDFQKPVKTKLKVPKKSPVIGYVGGLNDRLNFSLIIPLVKNNPGWKFVFWGPIQDLLIKDKPKIRKKIETLLAFPNVLHGKSRNKKEVPSIISQFDICIIPYDVTLEFNKYSYPIKLFEYFYFGKPVISTPILELKRFPKFVKIGSTKDQWESIIRILLSTKWPIKYSLEQKKLAEENSWENKIRTISSRIRVYEREK